MNIETQTTVEALKALASEIAKGLNPTAAIASMLEAIESNEAAEERKHEDEFEAQMEEDQESVEAFLGATYSTGKFSEEFLEKLNVYAYDLLYAYGETFQNLNSGDYFQYLQNAVKEISEPSEFVSGTGAHTPLFVNASNMELKEFEVEEYWEASGVWEELEECRGNGWGAVSIVIDEASEELHSMIDLHVMACYGALIVEEFRRLSVEYVENMTN